MSTTGGGHSGFEKLISFRLIFYSIVAASVLGTIPVTFRVGVGYPLFTAIILFIAVIETFLRLDEGDFVEHISQNAVLVIFLADIFAILGVFALASSLLAEYANYMVELSATIHVQADYLIDHCADVDRLRCIAVFVLVLFSLLLLRGVVDRRFVKNRKTMTTHWFIWGAVHACAIAVCLFVLFCLDHVDDHYRIVVNRGDVIADLANLPVDCPFVQESIEDYSESDADSASVNVREAIKQHLAKCSVYEPVVTTALARYSLKNPNDGNVLEAVWYMNCIHWSSMLSLILAFIYLFFVYSGIVKWSWMGTTAPSGESH